MIIYSNDTRGFLKDIPNIANILQANILERLGEESSDGEIRSWESSLRHMARIVDHPSVPKDAGIALEYNIPITNNRIDFIITGLDLAESQHAVIIELKQWSDIRFTPLENVVEVKYSDGLKQVAHPSYQAASYKYLLEDFNEVIQTRKVILHPCCYLHNYDSGSAIVDARFHRVTSMAPVFVKDDEQKLRDFINIYIAKGDRNRVIFEIDGGTIRPSKSLTESVGEMLAKKNPVFKLIDDQKVVYESILQAYDVWKETGKKVVVVIHGGPGTGKSVIAIRALMTMINRGRTAMYVTKNAAPRKVFEQRLYEQGMPKYQINSLLKSSGVFYRETHEDVFDMLIVDEAHRLQAHSGRYGNLGENQIKEIMRAARVSAFFVDDRQRVSLSDLGCSEAIYDAFDQVSDEHLDANGNRPHEWVWRVLELNCQFRCAGSDEYMNWLDHLLQYDNLRPIKLREGAYDIRLVDDPTVMMAQIKEHNAVNNKSRVVAGYCWAWESRNNKNAMDIVMPEFGFSYQWNFSGEQDWAIRPASVEQIGCIHTCQGLEFDYVGVIIGPDLTVEFPKTVECPYGDKAKGIIKVAPSKNKDSMALKGWRELCKTTDGQELVRNIIKNTYRTLMTRGMKGCYLYVVDPDLREYIRQYLPQ